MCFNPFVKRLNLHLTFLVVMSVLRAYFPVLLLSAVFAWFFATGAKAEEQRQQIDSLRHLLEQPVADTSRVKLMVSLASAYMATDNYASRDLAQHALKLARDIGFKYGEAIASDIIGHVHENMGDYQQALFCYLRSLQLSEEIGHNKLKANSLSYIGNVYFWQKKEQLAEAYYKDALRLVIRLRLQNSYAALCNNLGIVAFRQKKWDQAIIYYKLSVASALLFNSPVLASPYTNLAEIYMEMNRPDSAKYYYRKGLEHQTKPMHVVDCNIGLGRIYMNEGKYSKAEACLLNSLSVANKAGVRSYVPDIYKQLSLLYRRQNDYRKAFAYYELYHAVSDSIFNEKSARQINDAQSRYELEKKDKEILLLDQTRKTAEAQAESQKIFRNFFIAAFVFILIVSLVLVRNVMLKQKLNRALLEKNERMETDNSVLQQENAEAKYETLKSKVNPHFLFNSLTTLSSIVSDDKEAAILYIERFSDLYRMILETGEQQLVTLKKEMEVVQNYLYLQNIRYESDLVIGIDIPPGFLNDQVPPFSVQMIVENAVKHNMISEDYRLKLHIFIKDDHIVVTNSLQRRHNKPSSTGIGQKNIIERYRLLSTREPVFTETADAYIAKLPLIRKRQHSEETIPA